MASIEENHLVEINQMKNEWERRLHEESGEVSRVLSITIISAELLATGLDEGSRTFTTWTFHNNPVQYSPIREGKNPQYDAAANYRINLNDHMKEYFNKVSPELI